MDPIDQLRDLLGADAVHDQPQDMAPFLTDWRGRRRQLRESIPHAKASGGGNVKHDIALPLGTMDAFVRQAVAALQRRCADLQPLVLGHLGDGNLHFNVGVRSGAPTIAAVEREAHINAIVDAAVLRRGGSISAAHGLGQLRRALAQRSKPAHAWAMMRAVKDALDPGGRMNPGKLI